MYRLDGLPATEVLVRAAPRVGSGRGFRPRRTSLAETLVARFDLRDPGAAREAGTTLLIGP